MSEKIPGLSSNLGLKAAGVVVVGAVLVLAFAVTRKLIAGPPPVASVSKWSAEEISAPRAPTYAERVAALPDAAAAVAFIKPRMRNASGNSPDEGAEILAMWAAHKLAWDQMASLKATSHAKAMKDPEAERGNYICGNGLRVVQIRADRSLGPVVYRGLLAYDSDAYLSFVAVGSSGDIVERSNVHFCGIVTGVWEFPNVYNGVVQAIHVVGMFNLPENRPGLAKPAHRP